MEHIKPPTASEVDAMQKALGHAVVWAQNGGGALVNTGDTDNDDFCGVVAEGIGLKPLSISYRTQAPPRVWRKVEPGRFARVHLERFDPTVQGDDLRGSWLADNGYEARDLT